jgi:hypothetical protein
MSIKNNNLKTFFIKLVSISIAVIVIINVIFNLLLAERLAKIDGLLSISETKTRLEIRDKIRNEISKGIQKEYILDKEDRVLLQKLYLKIKKELNEIN